MISSVNIVFVSYLVLNEFKFIIEDKYHSFYNDDVRYESGIYTKCLYILNFEMLMFNRHNKKNILNNQY
jgi:hypothetical protein